MTNGRLSSSYANNNSRSDDNTTWEGHQQAPGGHDGERSNENSVIQRDGRTTANNKQPWSFTPTTGDISDPDYAFTQSTRKGEGTSESTTKTGGGKKEVAETKTESKTTVEDIYYNTAENEKETTKVTTTSEASSNYESSHRPGEYGAVGGEFESTRSKKTTTERVVDKSWDHVTEEYYGENYNYPPGYTLEMRHSGQIITTSVDSPTSESLAEETSGKYADSPGGKRKQNADYKFESKSSNVVKTEMKDAGEERLSGPVPSELNFHVSGDHPPIITNSTTTHGTIASNVNTGDYDNGGEGAETDPELTTYTDVVTGTSKSVAWDDSNEWTTDLATGDRTDTTPPSLKTKVNYPNNRGEGEGGNRNPPKKPRTWSEWFWGGKQKVDFEKFKGTPRKPLNDLVKSTNNAIDRGRLTAGLSERGISGEDAEGIADEAIRTIPGGEIAVSTYELSTGQRFTANRAATADEQVNNGIGLALAALPGAFGVAEDLATAARRGRKVPPSVTNKLDDALDQAEDTAAVAQPKKVANGATPKYNFNNGGCFVPGTLVHLASVPAKAYAGVVEDVEPSSASQRMAIEQVPLGARITTKNPTPGGMALPEWPEEGAWVEVRMAVQRLDGKRVEAQLLRPASWAEALRVGDAVPVLAEELEVDGLARVLSIDPVSAPASGPGNRVVGRFVTRGIESISRLTLTGGETLEGTPSHPVWHADRQEFVPMGELVAGDRVLGESGPIEIVAADAHTTGTSVYNLEVESEHVYRIGKAGVLVHNTGDDCPLVQIQTSDEKISAPPNKRGNAPIGDDGHPVELHHHDQTPDGVIEEMTRTDHRLGENFKKNHSNTGQEGSEIDRKAFDKLRKQHWEKEYDNGRFDNIE